MEDRKIIELYNYRSENALIETDKKYGKIVTFLICKLIKNTLKFFLLKERGYRLMNMYPSR